MRVATGARELLVSGQGLPAPVLLLRVHFPDREADPHRAHSTNRPPRMHRTMLRRNVDGIYLRYASNQVSSSLSAVFVPPNKQVRIHKSSDFVSDLLFWSGTSRYMPYSDRKNNLLKQLCATALLTLKSQ